MNAHRDRLLVFAKAPRLGMVKTRLAATVGPAAALVGYTALMETLFARISSQSCVEIHFSPADAANEFTVWLRSGWTTKPQCEGDLGQRLQHAFATAFDDGAEKVVAIGSDCPYLTGEDIEKALTLLSTYDAVIGPTADGGYWLIGLRRGEVERWSAVFKDISWSTGAVFQQTVDRLQSVSLKLGLLRQLDDVDTEADLRVFEAHQRAAGLA